MLKRKDIMVNEFRNTIGAGQSNPWKNRNVIIAGVVLIVVIFVAVWYSGGLKSLGGPGGQFTGDTGNCVDSDSDNSIFIKGYVQHDASSDPDKKVWDYCSKTREVGEQYCSNAGGVWKDAVKFVSCGSGEF